MATPSCPLPRPQVVADDRGQDSDELGIGVHRFGPHERGSRPASDLLRFDIHVIEDLQMICHKTTRAHHDRGAFVSDRFLDDLLQSWSEPWVGGTTGALPAGGEPVETE